MGKGWERIIVRGIMVKRFGKGSIVKEIMEKYGLIIYIPDKSIKFGRGVVHHKNSFNFRFYV